MTNWQQLRNPIVAAKHEIAICMKATAQRDIYHRSDNRYDDVTINRQKYHLESK